MGKKYTFTLDIKSNFAISLFDVLQISEFYVSYMNFNLWNKDG